MKKVFWLFIFFLILNIASLIYSLIIRDLSNIILHILLISLLVITIVSNFDDWRNH